MRSPFWKTYLALAVAAALGAYIYFVESKKEPSADGEKKKEKVLALDRAKVKSVALAAAGADEIRLVKDKDQWQMTSPLQVAADGTEVDSVLSALESLEVQDVVAESPSSVGEYGLDKPKVTVAVQQDGAPTTLQLGDKTPDASAMYARLSGKTRVFTVPAYVESSFVRKPFDFRDRDLLHLKRDAVKTLEITGPEGAYALARDEGGEWAFTKPLATRAGRWSVDGLLGTLEALRMDSVAVEEAKDAKPYGLDKPSRSVSLGLAQGEQKVLEIGSSAGDKKYYARVSTRPLVAVIPGAIVDDLAKGMGELRAKRLLEVATYEVTGFESELSGQKHVYARSTTKDKDGIDAYKWKRTAPDVKDLDTNKVQDALFAVGGVDVAEFVDAPGAPAAYGLDSPRLKVRILSEGKPEITFEIGEKDGAVYARRVGDAAVLKLDPKKAADLLKAFTEL